MLLLLTPFVLDMVPTTGNLLHTNEFLPSGAMLYRVLRHAKCMLCFNLDLDLTTTDPATAWPPVTSSSAGLHCILQYFVYHVYRHEYMNA
jgi:hypothetical protein